MDAVRAAILRTTADNLSSARFGDPYLPSAVSSTTGRPRHEVWEALWAMVADRLIYLDTAGQGPDNWGWRASALGRQIAAGGSWEPHDPDGYITQLRRRAPALEDAALRYVEEALRAFNARCFLACTVMLGVASEQVFSRMARAFADSQEDSQRLRALLDNPATTYYKSFTEFRKRFEPVRPAMPPGVADNITLDAVADLLRVARNAAGHPTGQMVDEETAYTNLQVAGRYLVKMTELAGHFEAVAAARAHPERRA